MNKKFKKIVSASSLLLAGSMGFNNTLNLPTSYKIVAADRDVQGVFDKVFSNNKNDGYAYDKTEYEVGKKVWFVVEDANGNHKFFTEDVTASNIDNLKSRNALVFHHIFKTQIETGLLDLTEENIAKAGGFKEDDLVSFIEFEKIQAAVANFQEFKQQIEKQQEASITNIFLPNDDHFYLGSSIGYHVFYPVRGKSKTVDITYVPGNMRYNGEITPNMLLVNKTNPNSEVCEFTNDATGEVGHAGCESIPSSESWQDFHTGSYSDVLYEVRKFAEIDRDLNTLGTPKYLKIDWQNQEKPQSLEKDQQSTNHYRFYILVNGEKIYLSDNYSQVNFYGSTKLYDHKHDNFKGYWTLNNRDYPDSWDYNNHSYEIYPSIPKVEIVESLFAMDNVYNIVEKGLLKVNHVDKQGKTLLPSKLSYGRVGQNYKTNAENIPSYNVVNPKPSKHEGSYIKGLTEVTYVYEQIPNVTPLPTTGTNNKAQTFGLISLISAALLFIGYRKKKGDK